MKKIIYVVALVAVILGMSILVGCQEKNEGLTPIRSGYYSIRFVAKIGNGDLKSAPVAPLAFGNWWEIDRQLPAGAPWALVDGTEFLPGSYASTKWGPNQNPVWYVNDSLWLECCPALPIKIIAKATVGDENSPISYIGISEQPAPTKDDFEVRDVICRRVGDRVRMNGKQLEDLFGYGNWWYSLEYLANNINVNATAHNSGPTDTGWPTYIYDGSPVPTTVTAGVADADGDRVFYDGLGYKISGQFSNADTLAGDVGSNLMKLTIHFDEASVVKYVSAPALGKSKRIILKSDAVSNFNSKLFKPKYVDIVEEDEELSI